jgi:hypothetical protein
VFHHHLPEALAVFRAHSSTASRRTCCAAPPAAPPAPWASPDTGRLAAGMRADLLLVDGDPLTDLAALTRPVAVWAAGRICGCREAVARRAYSAPARRPLLEKRGDPFG